MGIWNSHTSVGNILGSLIAGVWVNQQWGLSFIVPGVITAAMGIITFLFLIECEWTLPRHALAHVCGRKQTFRERCCSGYWVMSSVTLKLPFSSVKSEKNLLPRISEERDIVV